MNSIVRWRRFTSRVGWGTLLWIGLMMPMQTQGKGLYVIGEVEHPWNEPGASLQEVDVRSRPGWIGRQRVGPEENLALGALARGGRTWTSWDTETYFLPPRTEAMVDGKRSTGPFFVQVQKMGAYRRWTVYLDLGGQFGVNRVKVYASEVGDWLRDWIFRWYEIGMEGLLPQWIEVGVNDGDPGAVDVYGNPLLEPVWGETREVFPDLDATFPTRPTRYVGVTTVARADLLAIGELEVYGEGYVPRGIYVSPIIDMGALSDFGRLRWKGRKDPGARILISTRTGADPDPNVYWRKTEEGKLSQFDEEGRELTAEMYEALKSAQKGGITYDREHWSFWSGAYAFEESIGEGELASPSPRRYIQVRVEFLGSYRDTGELDWVGFEVSQPPIAHYVEGEIWPVEVRPSERITFSYAIRPRMKEADRGFDRLEIRTPIRVDRVRTVVRDGVEIPFDVEMLDDPPRFVVHFPKVDVNGMRLELTFDATVLRYGTTFEGRVFDSTGEEVAQRVIPGDAMPELEGNTLSVKTVLGGELITLFGAVPSPFTPNGDGVHDETGIAYDLLQLTGPAPVSLKVYDGLGRLVRRVYVGKDAAGRYARVWDGRDEAGDRVPPGTYLVRVSVQADALLDSKTGTVVVVY